MTDKPKRTRNTTALGAGEATDRVLALRAEMPGALKQAETDVREWYKKREEAILARVPDDLRPRALAMIAAEPVLPATVPDLEPAISPNLLEPPPEPAPGSVVEVQEKPKGRRA